MSYRTWLLIILLGFIGISQPGQSHAYQEQDQTRVTQFSLPVKIFESEESIRSREASEAERRKREIDDLAAQQGMNSGTEAIRIATEDMRDYSRIQTIGLVIGTIVLVWTFWETRKASRAATEAATATVNAFNAQIRPVLVVVPPTDEEIRRWRDSGVNDNLYFQIKNVGSGTAIITQLCRGWAATDGNELPTIHRIISDEELGAGPVKQNFHDSASETKSNEIAVGPGDISNKNLTRFDLRREINFDKAGRTFFYGYVEYRDIGFGRYRSGFCFIFNRDKCEFSFPWENNAQDYNYHKVINDLSFMSRSIPATAPAPAAPR